MVTEIVLQHQQLQKPWCIRLCISNHNKVWGYSVCWHGELQNSSTRDWDWNQSYDCLWNNLTLILTKHITCSGKTWEEEKDIAKATMVSSREQHWLDFSNMCRGTLHTLRKASWCNNIRRDPPDDEHFLIYIILELAVQFHSTNQPAASVKHRHHIGNLFTETSLRPIGIKL